MSDRIPTGAEVTARLRVMFPSRCLEWTTGSGHDRCHLPSGHDGVHERVPPACAVRHERIDATLVCHLPFDHDGMHAGTQVVQWL